MLLNNAVNLVWLLMIIEQKQVFVVAVVIMLIRSVCVSSETYWIVAQFPTEWCGLCNYDYLAARE